MHQLINDNCKMSKYESLVGLVSANVESLDVERYDFFGFES